MHGKPWILLVTHSGDYFTIDRVQEALEEMGYPTLRFNTDEFPLKAKITQRISTAEAKEVWIEAEGKKVNLREIGGTWIRKVFSSKFDVEMDSVSLQGCIKESAQVVRILLSCLDGMPVINQFDLGIAAENKFTQQRLARKCGLLIPDTLITNDPAEAKAFFYKHEGNVVAKMLTSIEMSMDGSAPIVYTNALTEEDLEDLDGLCYSPMVFQRKITKAYELRLIYVGGKVFTGKISVGEESTGKDDWRKSKGADAPVWEVYDTPQFLQEQVHKLMTGLSLSYGAFDFICDPQGKYHFLEVNPAGEWGMLERDLGLPIARAIAETLAEKVEQEAILS